MNSLVPFTLGAVLVAPLQALSPANQADAGRFEVDTTSVEGEPFLSVRADDAAVERLLTRVAELLDLEIEGLGAIGPTQPVTVFLEQRPAVQVVHCVAGAAGLRARLTGSALVVMDDTPPYPTRSELFDIAETSFLRALRDFPENEHAPAAEMSLAEVQEERGALAAAVNHYDYLIQNHFSSELVPDAMLRSGRHLAELGEWDDAAVRFDELAKLGRDHPYHALARLELARSLCHQGRAKRGLHTLDALETYYPTKNESELRERLLVRARALALLGDAVEALRALDLAAEYGAEGAADPRVLELRALALEHAGRAAQAAVAWMRVAAVTDGKKRETALLDAARSALEAGDDVGVLFLQAWAEKDGFSGSLDFYANEARARLGLDVEDVHTFTAAQRIERAEDLLGDEMTVEAVRALEALFRHRARLSEEEVVRVALAYARALEQEGLGEYAITVLREAVDSLTQAEERRRVYLLAAELLERQGRVADAIEAIQGRL